MGLEPISVMLVLGIEPSITAHKTVVITSSLYEPFLF